jgi:hypothetical protein
VTYKPKTHIRDERFADRTICGQPWKKSTKGGKPASETVVVSERGSANVLTCRTCVELLRATLAKPAG